MLATTLIKYQPFKAFLLENFPKPSFTPQKKKNTINLNPSLTGYAFENLFLLLTSTDKTVRDKLDYEFRKAESNIVSLKKDGARTFIKNEICYIGLNVIEYRKIISELKFLKYKNILVRKCKRTSISSV